MKPHVRRSGGRENSALVALGTIGSLVYLGEEMCVCV